MSSTDRAAGTQGYPHPGLPGGAGFPLQEEGRLQAATSGIGGLR